MGLRKYKNDLYKPQNYIYSEDGLLLSAGNK